MAGTKEIKNKEIQKIEESEYQDFKEKFEEMINISRIAAIIDVAYVARESIDNSKKCVNTIVNKGDELEESFVISVCRCIGYCCECATSGYEQRRIWLLSSWRFDE